MSDLDDHLDRVLIGGRQPVLVELAEPDPSWPRLFEEHRDRILAALGPAEIDHVGSTSVPGLAAKPIVDVQVVVPDLEAAVEPLVAAGYVLRVREEGHRVLKGEPPANVHLYLPGDPEIEAHLRFRDLLRTDPEARRRYEELKRSLAGRVWPDMNHYAEAKGPLIRELLRGQ
ncbi:MAG: GrpB family protein [Frankiales bacterium]|nr:MAG: GrpB family protein [Frankiales bacterium]